MIDGLVKTKRERCLFPLYEGVLGLNCTVNLPLVMLTVIFHQRVAKFCASDSRLVGVSDVPFTIVLLGCIFTLPKCICVGTIANANGAHVTF